MIPFTLHHDNELITITSDSCNEDDVIGPIIRLCSHENQIFLLDNKFQLYRNVIHHDDQSDSTTTTTATATSKIHLKKWKSKILDIDLYDEYFYLINENGFVFYRNLKELNNNDNDENDDFNNWHNIPIEEENKITNDTINKLKTIRIEVKRIKCNSIGKIFITKTNEIYGCGKCGDVLTTDNKSNDINIPIKLKQFENHKILDIDGGEKFFVILAREYHENSQINLNTELRTSLLDHRNYDEENYDKDDGGDGDDNKIDNDSISLNSFCRTKNSNDNNDLELNLKSIIDTGKNLIMTKIYTFGIKNDGLLGTGDHIKRSGINLLTNLHERGVCKISCGAEHSLAKTIDGKLYLWGLNKNEQINNDNDNDHRIDFSSPTELKLINNNNNNDNNIKIDYHILDAYCDDLSTIALDYDLKILQKCKKSIYNGKQYCYNINDNFKPPPQQQQQQQNYYYDNTNIPLILLSNNFLLQNSHLNNNNIQKNFLKYLKYFQLNTRILIQNRYDIKNLKKFIEKKKYFYNNFQHVKKLCEKYLDICNILVVSLQSIQLFYCNNLNIYDLLFIKYTNEMIKIYELYTNVYCDVISTNSLVELQKYFHKSSRDNITNIPITVTSTMTMATTKMTTKTSSSLPLHELNEKIFTQPFSQIFEIIKFILELIKIQSLNKNNSKNDYNIVDILNEKFLKWDLLRRTNRIDVEIADQTKDFWLKNLKLSTDLKTINRRVILDSSKLNLRLFINNKLITSSIFILFSDFLLQLIGNSGNSGAGGGGNNSGSGIGANQSFRYDLTALWIKIDNENSIKCITPEKQFTLVARNHDDKMIWYQELENSIKLALGKSINDKLSDLRFIKYTYSDKHDKYPGVICKGRWKHGIMHGVFHMKFPDGKIYNGNVRNGEIEGYGKMIFPSNTTYEGYFKFGKFSGYGILEIPGNQRYEGNFSDGLFHGHGELTTNSYTYIGDFISSTANGYGVKEMVDTGDKYMGLFTENKRSGIGIYMTMDDEYFEGIFIDDELNGEGVVIFDNGSYYEGEMNRYGPNGKGCFYMPNQCSHEKMNNENRDIKGTVLSGCLSGEWKKIKIQTGTILIDQEFSLLPKSIGQFTVNNDRKWKTLFDDWEYQVFGAKTTIANVKMIWNKIAAYTTNCREIEKIKNNLSNESYFARNLTLRLNKTDLLSKLSLTATTTTTTTLSEKYNSKNMKKISTESTLNSKCLNNSNNSNYRSKSTLEINNTNCNKYSSSYDTLPRRKYDYNFDRYSVCSSSSLSDFAILRNNSDNNINSITTTSQSNSINSGSSGSCSNSINNATDCIPYLDYIPNVSIDSLMQNDFDTIKTYLTEAFNDSYHPLHLLKQKITQYFCKSYGCWKIRPPSILAQQAVMEWESIVLRTYEIIRKLFPTLPEEPCCIEGSSEIISHINLLYPILLSEKLYSVMLVLYARKYLHKDEIYRQRIQICEKKTDYELVEILFPDNIKTFLTVTKSSNFNEAILALKQIEINYCPQSMLSVIKNSIKLIKDACNNVNDNQMDGKGDEGDNSSNKNSINLNADYMIPLTIFVVLRSGVIQIGAELALLEDLLGDLMNGLGYANYCYTTIKAAYEHIISESFFNHHRHHQKSISEQFVYS